MRAFFRIAWWSALACLPLLVGGCARQAAPAPGILLVVVDAMRADHLGCYGYSRSTSPTIDDLAAEGVVFESAISQASFSGPSYATILTGMSPQQHGVRDHPRVLSEEVETLAEVARRGGMRTGGFVAHSFLDPKWNYSQGFQDFRRIAPPEGVGQHAGLGPDVVDAAIAWLKDISHEQPFLLWVQLQEPHIPYNPPPPYDTLFGREPAGYRLMHDILERRVRRSRVMFSFREMGYSDSDLAHTIRLYDGEIAYADAQLGRLMDALRASGRFDTTLIAVTSDHGESLGEHEIYFNHDMPLYDPVIRVPWVMRYPLRLPENTHVAAQVRLMDLAPTLLDLVGLRAPEGAGGRSARAIIEGKEGSRIAFSENQPYKKERKDYPHYRLTVPGLAGKWRSVRTEDAKLILIPTAAGATEELYDLHADPAELQNLIDQRPELAKKMRALLREHLQKDKGLTQGQPDEEPQDEETLEQLRSLGYLG
ncbi:MAG: sulfatase [Acidobacteriota bacterium]|nr:sulfatase [Acidobacteriota bacterium]